MKYSLKKKTYKLYSGIKPSGQRTVDRELNGWFERIVGFISTVQFNSSLPSLQSRISLHLDVFRMHILSWEHLNSFDAHFTPINYIEIKNFSIKVKFKFKISFH